MLKKYQRIEKKCQTIAKNCNNFTKICKLDITEIIKNKMKKIKGERNAKTSMFFGNYSQKMSKN